MTSQEEFQNRRYSPDEKRHFLQIFARDVFVPGFYHIGGRVFRERNGQSFALRMMENNDIRGGLVR